MPEVDDDIKILNNFFLCVHMLRVITKVSEFHGDGDYVKEWWTTQ
jgi:hypothetical protein